MISRRIHSVSVEGLQDVYNYTISFPAGSDNIIIIAPNGYGKTALLILIQTALTLDIKALNNLMFRNLEIIFDDKRKWEFRKVSAEDVSSNKSEPELDLGDHYRKSRPKEQSNVILQIYDAEGTPQNFSDLDLSKVDTSVLARAMSRSKIFGNDPYQRIFDPRGASPYTLSDLIKMYEPVLVQDFNFRNYLERYHPGSMTKRERAKQCVFIDTQRLYNAKTQNNDVTEEVGRQSKKLAVILSDTFNNYAATSQKLDRSFPNRLIARAKESDVPDIQPLLLELYDIEKKRKRLTEAGILVEQEEQIAPPSEEFIPKVADALQIYVDDSKEKLQTFDGIYPQVSALRDLVNRKLAPKEVAFNRQKGAEIARGELKLGLEKLSSGEKHVFVMLFRLIFETPNSSLVLIDEPEISLHVLWQLEFMSDLLKIQSTNNFQCIIATHSPQIFQGMESVVVDLADQAQ